MERLSSLSKQFGPNPLSSTKKPTLTVTDSRNGKLPSTLQTLTIYRENL